MSLVDRFGRIHTALRLSVTDRCNIRCSYCMPSEVVKFLPRPEILTFEELCKVTRIFADLGINKIRLTGGEPLVRKDLPNLVQQLKQIQEITEIALTTNAILMRKFAGDLRKAGLDRINVSLDTLNRKRFQEITRRDNLNDALDGIQAARDAGFENIRLNAVAVQGLIEPEIVPLIRFSIENNLEPRFIEFMPLNSTGDWKEDDVLTGKKIKAIVEQEFGPLTPVSRDDPSKPATDFRIGDSDHTVGFINSVSEPFCESCNRLRLTADGKIRNCLFSHEEWDIRSLIRGTASNQEIIDLITECVSQKNKAHGIGTKDFEKPARAMYQIGG